ncbi:ATP-binding cassette sub-family B member 9 [Liparis tanakae]|uniref:ATP-binding cassette sub-family B member 9 n=1 Tax=Liparis tanakae TaxID=230148 RepID=A0A4Z2FMX9_9TELE|nr:ATP-binding cassette sub-family B member 9 [Liparis tanakae]
MGVPVAVLCSVSFVLLDLLVSSLLFAHVSHWAAFRDELLAFRVVRSSLDLWGAALLRAALLLGACGGVSWNRRDGPPRVAAAFAPVLFVALVLVTYALAKLLMLSEQEPASRQPWALGLVGWTCASSLGVALLWTLLGKEADLVPIGRGGRGGGGGGCEDTEKLVETAGEEEEEEKEVGCETTRRKKKKEEEEEGRSQEKSSSGATLGRLLGYCRKDGGLLSVAVLFLVVSAVCE